MMHDDNGNIVSILITFEFPRLCRGDDNSLMVPAKSVTTGKAGGLKDCEPLKAVYLTDILTTIRWSTI